MKLGILSECLVFYPILEGYGKVLDIDYTNWQRDPKPKVVQLGTWLHPNTRNQLVAGINLNYLSTRDVEKLRYYLPEILKNRNLYVRYHTGKRLLPDIFKDYYRTYRRDRIRLIDKATLRFMTPKELGRQGDKEKAARLQQRRDKLRGLKVVKGIRPSRRPIIEPEMPPEEEPLPLEKKPEVPPKGETPLERPESTSDRAKAAVDAARAPKLMARIDDRTKALLAKAPEEEPEEAPEEEVPEETPEEEVPEEEPEESSLEE